MSKFYGQLEQDKFLYERYFSETKNGISIECGAFDGVMESATFFFEESLNWVSINIEAAPPIYDMLIKNRPKAINFNFGLGNIETKETFKHAIHPSHGVKFGNGSFNHKSEHQDILRSQNCTFQEYEVDIKTYESLIDRLMDEKFPNRVIDLFVLDVEGFEIEVIEGMRNSKYLPKIMCVEFPHVGLENLKTVLAELGYDFDIINESNAYFIKK